MESSEYSNSGYSIKIGEITDGSTLEERIQAAKVACLYSNPTQKRYNKGMLHMINRSNIPLEKEINICTSVTSAQNRLIRAREEIKNKNMLKMLSQKDYLKFRKDAKPLELDNICQDTNTLMQNKNKTIRWNSLNIKTVVSTKSGNKDNFEVSNKNECFGFNRVIPKTISAQQRLENIKKVAHLRPTALKVACLLQPIECNNLHTAKLRKSLNNDQIMEWEDFIESNDLQDNVVVDKVNDLRKNEQEFDELMEWTPDSVMDSDQSYLIKTHCLVIDTNVFLLDLKSVVEILDTCVPDYGYLTIVLPYQVLCELDTLKNYENELAYQAREATRWLLGNIKKNHPRLKGQPMTFSIECSDDAILKCAIDIKDKVNSVCLITNDKILSLKSLFSGIPCQNSSWLKNLVSSILKLQGLPLSK